MQRSLTHISILAGAVFLLSCGGSGSGTDEGGSSSSGATSGSTEGATTGACTPGSEGCGCYEGNLCLVGLKCLSDLCVDPGAPEPTGGTASSGEATDSGNMTSGTTAGGDDDCQDNSECGPEEICFDSFCTDPYGLTYWVTITKFAPESCADGFGDAELYYKVFLDGAQTETSPSVGCPGDWSAEIFDYDPASSLEIEFWDVDAIEDDFITSLCWIDENDACGPVPASVLHDGGFSGLDASLKYTLKVEFTVAIEAP